MRHAQRLSFANFHAPYERLLEWCAPIDFDVPAGWREIVAELFMALDTCGAKLRGCKVKMGELRCVMMLPVASDRCFQLIDHAERKSRVTCEHCGKPGRRETSGGWTSVACDDHAKGTE